MRMGQSGECEANGCEPWAPVRAHLATRAGQAGVCLPCMDVDRPGPFSFSKGASLGHREHFSPLQLPSFWASGFQTWCLSDHLGLL